MERYREKDIETYKKIKMVAAEKQERTGGALHSEV